MIKRKNAYYMTHENLSFLFFLRHPVFNHLNYISGKTRKISQKMTDSEDSDGGSTNVAKKSFTGMGLDFTSK